MRQSVSAEPFSSGNPISGADLERGLASNAFDAPAEKLVGMVKASTEPSYIAFTPSGCDSWIDIPTSMIASAERVGHQTCKDHSHPVFALSLTEPNDPYAKILLALLNSVQARGPLLGVGADTGNLLDPDFDAPPQAVYMVNSGNFGGIEGKAVCRGCHEVCIRQKRKWVPDFTGTHGSWQIICEQKAFICDTCKKSPA